MYGTAEHSPDAQHPEPSPLMAEIENRLRGIIGTGTSLTADQRREARRRDMEMVRLSVMKSAVHTSEFICGNLPDWQCMAFERTSDPVASLANLSRAIAQLALAEDRFDESPAERMARIEAEAARALAERTLRRAENKRDVENSVRAIALDYIRLPFSEREAVFKELFAELDDDAYDGDPAEIVADCCARMSLAPMIAPDKEIRSPNGGIDLAARKAKLLAFARKYLDLMKPPVPVDDRDETGLADPSAPPTRAQGPPH
jgi:hypothetical protein